MKAAASTLKEIGAPETLKASAKSRGKRATSIETGAAQVKRSLHDEWIPRMYRELIMPLRTRSHNLPESSKGARVEVQHTLLGVELKVGRRRISCPDLATARYLAVFARAGCAEVAVPYDITKISSLADKLESAWQRMLLLVEHEAKGRSKTVLSRLRTILIGEVRDEIGQMGAGAAIPQFNQNTKQRPRRI